MYAERGDRNKIGQESSQLNILFVTRPDYKNLAESLSKDISYQIATNLDEGSQLVLANGYSAVVTDDSSIARKAAEKRTPFILLESSPKLVHALLTKRNPCSYCINPTEEGFVSKFCKSMEEILNFYQEQKLSKQKPKTTILLVEDDEHALFLYKMTLEEKGYGIKTASTVEEASSVIAQEKLDIIISDLCLSNAPSGGMHVVQIAHSKDPDIPVVIHTGNTNPKLYDFLEKAGAYKIITKSADSPQKLVEAVGEILEKKEKQKGLSTKPFSDGTIEGLVKEIDQGERFLEEFKRTRKEVSLSNLF